MGEGHSHLHEFDDPEGLKPQELAAMRWQAIEAFNGVLGLSPMARRLGIKLISCMDARTRACYPGEARIAAELGVHLSAIKKAKAELKDAKLINWSNPGGPRHLSHYTFDWAAPFYSTHTGTNQRDVQRRQSTQNEFHSTQIEVQGTHTGTPIVPTRVPDTTLDITNGGLGCAEDLDGSFIGNFPSPDSWEAKRLVRKKAPSANVPLPKTAR